MELVVVIVIVAVMATIAVRTLKSSYEITRIEQTKEELDQLARAIAGRPDILSGGQRTDYGYIGDVGAMPPNLDALVNNPGGYNTWDGPYVHDDFYAGVTGSETEFMIDAWGDAYAYSGGITITSEGGGKPIIREIAPSLEVLLSNLVSTVITDIDHTPPGIDYLDSLHVGLIHPDGFGSMIHRWTTVGSGGRVEFEAVPIGCHLLRVVYIPTGDTITRWVDVAPGQDYHLTVTLPEDYW